VVSGELWEVVDVEPRCGGGGRVCGDVARHEAEKGRRDGPFGGDAIRVGEHRQLFEVRDSGEISLFAEVTTGRRLQGVAVADKTAGKPPHIGLLGRAMQQNVQRVPVVAAFADLEHSGEDLDVH
jgi:hypothetical protein